MKSSTGVGYSSMQVMRVGGREAIWKEILSQLPVKCQRPLETGRNRFRLDFVHQQGRSLGVGVPASHSLGRTH